MRVQPSWTAPISFIALIIALIFSSIAFNYDQKQQKLWQQMQSDNRAAEQLIYNRLAGFYGDLKILSHEQAVINFAEYRELIDRNTAEQTFLSIMKNRAEFMQLRLLDTKGQEIIRVDRNTNGQVYAIEEIHLQNKASRYYFQEARKLPMESIFQSPLDLNIESGQIEIPHKPTIRFATPVGGKDITGYLIVNIQAQALLNKLKQLNSTSNGQIFLVNNQGYYLNNNETELNWGFMFGETKNNFAQHFPSLWQRLQQNGGTQKLQNPEQMILAQTMCLAASCNLINQNYKVETLPASSHWFIISQHPRVHWWQLSKNEWIVITLLLILSLLILIWFKRNQNNEVEHAHKILTNDPTRFKDLLQALPQPACIIDEKGQLIGFNQTVADLFNLNIKKQQKISFYNLLPDTVQQEVAIRMHDAIAEQAATSLYDEKTPLPLQLAHKPTFYLTASMTPIGKKNANQQLFLVLLKNITLDIYRQKQKELSAVLHTISELSNELLLKAPPDTPTSLLTQLEMCASHVQLSKKPEKLKPLLQQWLEQLDPEIKSRLDIDQILVDNCVLNLDQSNFNRFMNFLMQAIPKTYNKMTLQTKHINITEKGKQISLHELPAGDYMQIYLKGENVNLQTETAEFNKPQNHLEKLNGCKMRSGDYLPLGSAFGLVKQCHGSMRIECSGDQSQSRTIFIYLPIISLNN